jgi:hypothetical protein
VGLLAKGSQQVPVIVSAWLVLKDGHLTGVLSVHIDIAAWERRGEG